MQIGPGASHTISKSMAIRGWAYYVPILLHSWSQSSASLQGVRLTLVCSNPYHSIVEASLSYTNRYCTLVGVNYRLKPEDIAYIFNHSEADAIIVDKEFLPLLNDYRKTHPDVPLIVDTDTDATEGELSGPFDAAVLEGLKFDTAHGNQGWEALEAQAADEDSLIALAYTSGTTARPKGVEYTHRSCYVAALGNVIESGLNPHQGRCRYLWTLPMFHAMGKFQHVSLPIFYFYFLGMKRSSWFYFRMDFPMGYHRCAGYALLFEKDRLPRNLEIAKARENYAFQRSSHSQHSPLQFKGG